MSNYFSEFHKKTLQERMQILSLLYPQLNGSFKDCMDLKTADLMIENCIGRISLPVGLGLHFMINSKEYTIPMTTEEPSIIAAASAAAKFIKEHGGFTSSSTAPIMQGQIQILDIDPIIFSTQFNTKKPELILKANTAYCPRMVSRGGGVIDIKFQNLSQTSGVIELNVNVGEAMGANIVNTICEGLAEDIRLMFNCRVGLKILSNFCTERRATARFEVPISMLEYKKINGEAIAKGFMESYEFAKQSVHRACTHNKGILNGMQAVGIATGQDTRAIEAAAHAWACRNGTYWPLNSYEIQEGKLCGFIEIPIAVGTKGGALSTNPAYQASAYILGNPSSMELGQIIACVGLACNFSAIRSMITEGIQKGHMGLHAKNIALASGVPSEIVQEVVEYMKLRGNISQQTALDYLAAHKLHAISRKNKTKPTTLNTFYANLADSQPPLKLNIAFHCSRLFGVHIVIDKAQVTVAHSIKSRLFTRSNYNWITSFLSMLNEVRFKPRLPRTNEELQVKIKLICIWINEISINLIKTWGVDRTEQALLAVIEKNEAKLEVILENSEAYIEYGVYLILELWYILNFHLDDFVSASLPYSDVLAQNIKNEMITVINSNIKASRSSSSALEELLIHRKKQMCATLMYLCDCLGEAEINLDLMNELIQVGDVIEILSTVSRDLNKVLKGEKKPPNIFITWSAAFGEDSKKYFEYFHNLTSAKTQLFNQSQISLIRKAEKLLKVYYSQTPKL